MNLDFENMLYTGGMKKKRQDSSPTESGKRLAALRKAAGLSQVQLAAMIDIPQRTLSFYETNAENIPSGLVPILADALGVSIEEILGISQSKSKRGPKSKLERQLDYVRRLPKSEQDFVSKFLDNVIQQAMGK
jgi:transcriptional regulator with XRE-family HTH domain